ncbi:ABC-type nitrate/sulfonate/bicarbonate transport system substrate-binding protein [Primorskyibacter sedentarius]|uniref:ABC-type nitrate/sulfonate/bicarbonate transport system substrate-binding protein n=1 Tax=Primorskyibacter sedentarius TaxID=745311 RepID=A0A4R3IWH6_9RHOB|nr:ABC transporter substrate-binding protein [Primorskyibacter sedentarius]TCS56151.1 ABC-type nitrate/sulfonate/bicarbonate transport system substrate-binding protein [Primorskyibacter sedentarius]
MTLTLIKRLAAGAALVALAAGGALADTKVHLNSQPNEAGYPMWLADHLGYFGDNGLEVETTYFPNGGTALASGVSGDWQAGWTGGPPAISGWDKFKLISFGTMQKESRNIKLIMRKDAMEGMTPGEALAKVRIGTVPNSTWSQVLFACADHFGVAHGDLEIVPLDPPVTRQSLRNGEVGAGTTAASADFDIVNDKDTFEVVCDGEVAGTSVIAPWIITNRFWTDDPEAAAKFVDAAYRANEYIRANPDKAVDLALQYYEDTGIEGDKETAAYAFSLRDFQTLDEAIADMESGATIDALIAGAEVLVAAGAYDEVPDLKSMQPVALDVLMAAKALRK